MCADLLEHLKLCILLDLVFTWIIFFIVFPNTSSGFEFASLKEKLLGILIVSPVLETYFIQYSCITLLRKIIKNDFIILIITAILFGLLHNYSLSYVIKGFGAGLIYSSEYLILEKKKEKPLLWVMVTHSLFNLVSFTLDYLI